MAKDEVIGRDVISSGPGKQDAAGTNRSELMKEEVQS